MSKYARPILKKLRDRGFSIGYKGFDMYLFHFKKQHKLIDDNISIMKRMDEDSDFFELTVKSLKQFKLFNNGNEKS